MDPKTYAQNRLNSMHSTGPRTELGKRRASLNAIRHSITSRVHIATPEESAAFDKHCRNYHEALLPAGLLEPQLVQEIAEDKWRLKRIRTIEDAIFAQGHHDHVDELPSGNPEVDAALAEGKTWVEQARSLQLLTLYESRIRRAIEKHTAEFKAMQAERKAAHAKAQREAIALAQLAAAEGKPYQPAYDFVPAFDYGGFVFSPEEIARVIDREDRLKRAFALPQSIKIC
jgi:hypothetical protein